MQTRLLNIAPCIPWYTVRSFVVITVWWQFAEPPPTSTVTADLVYRLLVDDPWPLHLCPTVQALKLITRILSSLDKWSYMF